MAQVIDAGIFGKYLETSPGVYLEYASDPNLGAFTKPIGSPSTAWQSYTPPVATVPSGEPTPTPPEEPQNPLADPTRPPTTKPEKNYVWEWVGERWIQRYRPEMALEEQARREQGDSARSVIQNLMSQYGLDSLTDFVNNLITTEDIISGDVILGRIRQTDQYKRRFAGNEVRRKAGFNALSEAEYVGMENTYRQIMRQSGLPLGFYDSNDDFTNLISGDVSAAELSSRITEGYLAVQNSDPAIIGEMRRLYGMGDADIAAYFLDPQKATPMLLRQAQAAQVAGQAKLQAGQEISTIQAEALAVAGVSQEEARQGFQTIAQAGELFVPLPGTTEQAISQEEQIAGVFGTQAAAQQRLRQRQRERATVFEAGGRFAGQGTTVTGLQ